jgi:hypothetical protein
MKTWHIAALVIVGLIVAGIAYTMYEKKRGRLVGGGGGKGGSAILNNHQRQKDNPSIIPGDVNNGKKEPERPGGPDVFDSGGGRIINDDLIDAGWGLY